MSPVTRKYYKLALSIPILTLCELAAIAWIPLLGSLAWIALLCGTLVFPVLFARFGEEARGVAEDKRNPLIFVAEVLLWFLWYFLWLNLVMYLAMPYRGIPDDHRGTTEQRLVRERIESASCEMLYPDLLEENNNVGQGMRWCAATTMRRHRSSTTGG